MKIVHKWAEPRPGFERHYSRAWKHRAVASVYMSRLSPLWSRRKFLQAQRIWADAVDRTKRYGQDIVEEAA